MYSALSKKLFASVIRENLGNRSLLIWGACRKCLDAAIELVGANGIHGFIDSDPAIRKEAFCGYPVYAPESLADSRASRYVLVPLYMHTDIVAALHAYGYRQDRDYVYPAADIHSITITSACGYQDVYGNQIIGNANNINITFQGYNSTVTIDEGFSSDGTSQLVVDSNCQVRFGTDTVIGSNCSLYFRNESDFSCNAHCQFGDYVYLVNKGQLQLGAQCVLDDYSHIYVTGNASFGDYFTLRNNSEFVIEGNFITGQYVFFQHHANVFVVPDTSLSIGDNSGFSWYVNILTGSGHSIIDRIHQMNLEELSSRTVTIGAHVWAASQVTILRGSRLADNTVISACSVVRSSTTPHSLYSGNPAKPIMRDIDWNFHPSLSFEEYGRLHGEDVPVRKVCALLDKYGNI